MPDIKYTLIADGSSDKALMNIIQWSLDSLFPYVAFNGEFADFRNMPQPPSHLKEKVRLAEKYYPFQILFIHRDAESNNNDIITQRIKEIFDSLESSHIEITVCVIPVRMTEAWLLINKEAIKKAAGNRNFQGDVNLPPLNRLELLTEPKQYLYNILKEASGLKGRNLKKFNPNKRVHLLAEYIDNYEVLRNIGAFNSFETDLKYKISNYLKKICNPANN